MCHNFDLERDIVTRSVSSTIPNQSSIEILQNITIGLKYTEPVQRYKAASYYPKFSEDELTNVVLLNMSPLDKGNNVTMRELLSDYELPEAKGLVWFNTAQSPKEGGEYLEALLHGSFVKASWTKGLIGLPIHQFIASIAAEFDYTFSSGVNLTGWDHDCILKDVFNLYAPVFPPTDIQFSEHFKDLDNFKSGISFTVADKTEVDGYAFASRSDDILFTLEAKGRSKPVGSDTLVSIVQKAQLFASGQNRALGNRKFTWHLVLVILDQIVDNFKMLNGLPDDVRIYHVEKRGDVEFRLAHVKFSNISPDAPNPMIVILLPLNNLSSTQRAKHRAANVSPSSVLKTSCTRDTNSTPAKNVPRKRLAKSKLTHIVNYSMWSIYI